MSGEVVLDLDSALDMLDELPEVVRFSPGSFRALAWYRLVEQSTQVRGLGWAVEA